MQVNSEVKPKRNHGDARSVFSTELIPNRIVEVKVMIAKAGVIVISEAVRTRAAEAKVRERVGSDNCVACPDDDVRKHTKKGLCPRCDARLTDELAKLGSEQERADFVAEAYRQGLVLNPQEIREIKAELTKTNVFVEIRKSIKKR
jgi:hypothetical protein